MSYRRSSGGRGAGPAPIQEFRRKKEGRRKKEEGGRKKEEGKNFSPTPPTPPTSPTSPTSPTPPTPPTPSNLTLSDRQRKKFTEI
jgi:hypothetical protein